MHFLGEMSDEAIEKTKEINPTMWNSINVLIYLGIAELSAIGLVAAVVVIRAPHRRLLRRLAKTAHTHGQRDGTGYGTSRAPPRAPSSRTTPPPSRWRACGATRRCS